MFRERAAPGRESIDPRISRKYFPFCYPTLLRRRRRRNLRVHPVPLNGTAGRQESVSFKNELARRALLEKLKVVSGVCLLRGPTPIENIGRGVMVIALKETSSALTTDRPARLGRFAEIDSSGRFLAALAGTGYYRGTLSTIAPGKRVPPAIASVCSRVINRSIRECSDST